MTTPALPTTAAGPNAASTAAGAAAPGGAAAAASLIGPISTLVQQIVVASSPALPQATTTQPQTQPQAPGVPTAAR